MKPWRVALVCDSFGARSSICTVAFLQLALTVASSFDGHGTAPLKLEAASSRCGGLIS
jgi:hypothetical protein